MADYDFEQGFTVHQYECDVNSHMLAGSLLRRAQQISTNHCDAMGLTLQTYENTNTAFLLAKTQVFFESAIKYNQAVIIKTKAYAPQRAVYAREVFFFTPNDELLATVDSRWILIDTQTKHILRRPPQDIEKFFYRMPLKLNAISIEKAQTEKVCEMFAQYTMCDVNRHINNTAYADIVYNNINSEILEKKYPKSLLLNYHNEIPLNASFDVYLGETVNEGYYICAENEGLKHFEANIYF